MLRGLAVTGGVITSAGIVLAGTFSVLAVLPLVFLTEIGFVIAFGVLLDTFIVRSILVPGARARHRPADLVAVEAHADEEDAGDDDEGPDLPGAALANGRAPAPQRIGGG